MNVGGTYVQTIQYECIQTHINLQTSELTRAKARDCVFKHLYAAGCVFFFYLIFNTSVCMQSIYYIHTHTHEAYGFDTQLYRCISECIDYMFTFVYTMSVCCAAAAAACHNASRSFAIHNQHVGARIRTWLATLLCG